MRPSCHCTTSIMHGLPARAPRRLRMPSHVGSAWHPTLTTRHTHQSIERENPAGHCVGATEWHRDRDAPRRSGSRMGVCSQSYRHSSLDKATLSGTTRKARKCAYRRRRIGPSSEVHDVGGSGSRKERPMLPPVLAQAILSQVRRDRESAL